MEDVIAPVIEELLERSSAFTFSSVSTVDGRALAFRSRNASDAARVSAIASSLLALSESFAREVKQAGSHWTTISNEDGSIVLIRIPAARRIYVLAVGADTTQNLATTLHFAVRAGERIAGVIDALTPSDPVTQRR